VTAKAKTAQTYKYSIKFLKDQYRPNGAWRVLPDPNNPAGRPLPGSVLTWAFDKYEPGLEAHFQFCNFVVPANSGYGEVCFLEAVPNNRITQDWVATISGTSPELTAILLHVLPQKIHYAVWIVDPHGNTGFAIGTNPPPDIQTGP
jgi:hypothetical protein